MAVGASSAIEGCVTAGSALGRCVEDFESLCRELNRGVLSAQEIERNAHQVQKHAQAIRLLLHDVQDELRGEGLIPAGSPGAEEMPALTRLRQTA
jgi:hypothetical protein